VNKNYFSALVLPSSKREENSDHGKNCTMTPHESWRVGKGAVENTKPSIYVCSQTLEI
jgi:hypothetical protein